MVRADFVKRKVNLIAEDLQRLAAFRNLSFQQVVGDFVKLAAVERLIERIVMRAIDVNAHLIAELATGREGKTSRLAYKDTFLKLAGLGVYPGRFAARIGRSAGLRNILVHDYNDADRRIVYASIRACLVDYRRYAGYVLAFLKRGGGP